ncbi:MAG: DUF692 family protein [Polyangiaceae bacterium]
MRVGLSLLPADDLRLAQAPLFAAGVVDAVEVTLDHAMGDWMPDWMVAVADHYSGEGALYGHGVHFSTLSAILEPRHLDWLGALTRETERRRYVHVSEHFGFMTVPGVRRGAPLPIPFTKASVELGRDRLSRLTAAARAPVGLENLGLAMSARDALALGEFMEQVLAPSDGFLLLDLHNLYCAAVSYSLDPRVLLSSMPLQRVRELHVSGGSLYTPKVNSTRPFRRDTHDGPVPEVVFELVSAAIPQCPKLEVVILERLGNTLSTPEDVTRYREDFMRLAGCVERAA